MVEVDAVFFGVSALVAEWCGDADLVLVEVAQPPKPKSNRTTVEFNNIFCTLVLSMISTPFKKGNLYSLLIHIITLLKHYCKECYGQTSRVASNVDKHRLYRNKNPIYFIFSEVDGKTMVI
ncbi:hypothetical protein PS376_08460 [Limosilactobacillus pontis]|uniref:hypothetical protein n=1 Tax=Limosilactobacillus pontis TaxID=35787 RepID=UPI002F2688A0